MKKLLFLSKMMSLILLISLLLNSCSQDTDLFNEVVQENIEEQIDHEENTQEPEDNNQEEEEDAVVDDEISSELKAFPSAYGAGAFTTGGRGGKIIHVTNLNDSGPGSFREALLTPEKRIIVFDVSGIIELESLLYVTEGRGNFTIAGQTAPEGGITIAGNRIFFYDGVDNFIIRYVRFRGGVGGLNDSLTCQGTSNVIFDHCSFGFGYDEAMSITSGSVHISNITIQRCLFGESKTGTIVGALPQDGGTADNISVINNLWYNITHRFPNVVGDGRFEVVNNVVWGWVHRTLSTSGSFELNHLNNWHYFSTQNGFRDMYNMGPKYSVNEGKISEINSEGNVYEPGIYTDVSADNFEDTWSIHLTDDAALKRDDPLPAKFKGQSRFDLLGGAPVPLLSASETYDNVSGNVGANVRLDAGGNVVDNKDILDANYLNNVQTLTYVNRRTYLDYFIPSINSQNGYEDTDNDGMPDVWEQANGFNPSIDDSAQDADGDGYTNIEEFLNLVDMQ
ncbi:hypothetical protein [Flagellimonas sp. S3867]|uniref:hypothetical protein n=1 Tax=Flagellimonas sp. S3867 TaxID=2768063 RepID=UPI0016860392|nr:hypothetical protein [Flagellimonas sp. S3867]